MARVGCGYETLGGLIHVDPKEIKRVAREVYGIRRPIGLMHGEFATLAKHFGYKMMGIGPIHFHVTCSGLVAQRRKEAKRDKRSKMVVIHTRGHYQGAYVGADGSVSRVGWFRAGAKVIQWWVLKKIEEEKS